MAHDDDQDAEVDTQTVQWALRLALAAAGGDNADDDIAEILTEVVESDDACLMCLIRMLLELVACAATDDDVKAWQTELLDSLDGNHLT